MWSLRRKILLGYAAIILLAGVVLGVALLNIVRLGEASNNILQENYRSILAAEQMLNALQRQENASMQLVVGIDPSAVVQFSESEKEFLLWLERAKANITIQGEREILERIENGYTEFLLHLAKFRNAFQGDSRRGLEYYQQELAPRARQVARSCEDLHELNRRTMESSSRRAQQVARVAVWSVALVGAVVIFSAAVASAWLSNKIVRPVKRLGEATERVAAGDYETSIEPESQDEIGQLAQKFGVMLAKLRAYHQLNLRRIVGEQRKAEAILKAIDDGVVVVGPDGYVKSLNPAAARVLSVPLHAAEGAAIADLVTDERLKRAVTEALSSRASAAGEQGRNLIKVNEGPDRESFYEYAVTPVSAPDGEVAELILLLRNVTALKQLDQLKTEFVMTASHELRSPLTSIAMSIGLLRERAAGKLDDSDRQLVEVAQEEVERLRTLVEELLDLSKIESGKLEVEFADVAVSPIVEAAVAPFQAQAQETSIRLTCQGQDRLPLVRADANKLTWVVTNLVGNAMRYARSEVAVSAEAAGRWVQIYVRDDGPGIPWEAQARIFDKFVQLGGGKTAGGAGLGLAISKEIVKAHHGNIWVESEPGKGSLFIVALPITQSITSGKPA